MKKNGVNYCAVLLKKSPVLLYDLYHSIHETQLVYMNVNAAVLL
jgi:hypothetical protein